MKEKLCKMGKSIFIHICISILCYLGYLLVKFEYLSAVKELGLESPTLFVGCFCLSLILIIFTVFLICFVDRRIEMREKVRIKEREENERN